VRKSARAQEYKGKESTRADARELEREQERVCVCVRERERKERQRERGARKRMCRYPRRNEHQQEILYTHTLNNTFTHTNTYIHTCEYILYDTHM